MRAPVWVAAGVLLAGAALSGCEAGRVVKAPDFSDIDVATPEMTQIKARGGIADCPTGPVTNGPLPAETLRCLGGGTATDLSTLEGPLVLNFWSSTCEPCEREMPALQEFHERYGDRVPILGVDTHDTLPQLALEKAVRWGVTYPLLADPGGELQGTDLTITGQPTFFFLREDGRITTTKGGLESVDQVVAMVEKQLEIDL